MKKIIAANWKLFKGPQETRQFFKDWERVVFANQNELVFFPSAIALEAAAVAIADLGASYAISFGAQNTYCASQGAFTGENSASVVKELGGKYVLVGHSERRTLFSESNSLIADKVSYLQGLDLVPMLCVGETLAEREANQTTPVLREQLGLALKKADKTKKIVLAYEPVWAIGTGKVATPEQVHQTHQEIHDMLKELGYSAPVLYGGSVKPDNAQGLARIEGVDGFLVGGASLEVSTFKNICESF